MLKKLLEVLMIRRKRGKVKKKTFVHCVFLVGVREIEIRPPRRTAWNNPDSIYFWTARRAGHS